MAALSRLDLGSHSRAGLGPGFFHTLLGLQYPVDAAEGLTYNERVMVIRRDVQPSSPSLLGLLSSLLLIGAGEGTSGR